ncbi:MAG: hypothetical protein IJ741_10595 [Schwartzia sp.]|nr:hypothetical protein [Schwartzia sp. (in: firmicutes)]
MTMDNEKKWDGAELDEEKKMSDEELDGVSGGNWNDAVRLLTKMGRRGVADYSATQMHEAVAQAEKEFRAIGIEAHLNATKKGTLWGYNKHDGAATFIYRDSEGHGHALSMDNAVSMLYAYQSRKEGVGYL